MGITQDLRKEREAVPSFPAKFYQNENKFRYNK